MATVEGLEKPCPTCGRVSGDHTLREWAKCLDTTTTDLEWETTGPGMAEAANAAMRERFGLEDDWLIADNVVIRSATLDAGSGVVGIKLPALIHEFSVALPEQPPHILAKIVFIGPADVMRKYGKLARDSANGAANAAEGR